MLTTLLCGVFSPSDMWLLHSPVQIHMPLACDLLPSVWYYSHSVPVYMPAMPVRATCTSPHTHAIASQLLFSSCMTDH